MAPNRLKSYLLANILGKHFSRKAWNGRALVIKGTNRKNRSRKGQPLYYINTIIIREATVATETDQEGFETEFHPTGKTAGQKDEGLCIACLVAQFDFGK